MTDDRYRPLSGRKRLRLALAAVVTAITIILVLLQRPGGVWPERVMPADSPACAEGQTIGCVGGKVELIAPAASGVGAAR